MHLIVLAALALADGSMRLALANGWDDPPEVLASDTARFIRLLENAAPERRIEGLQGLANLKHWPSEEEVIKRLADPAPEVQREALLALCRLGTATSVPHLISRLDHASWEIRQHAWIGLRRLTAMELPGEHQRQWEQWWNSGAVTNHVHTLLNAIARPASAIPRPAACRALRCFVQSGDEVTLMALLHRSGLSREERACIAEALERVGSAKAIPTLAGFPAEEAAWALGRIGGPEAEQALLRFPKTLPVWINLDRLHSTNCAPWIPHLVSQMALVTYRSQPDDLMNHDAQPIQRVGANLIRRSGQAPEFIHQVLLELEYSMNPPPQTARPPIPDPWKPMLEAMRSELKPGFVREDGVTTSQPLTALYHVATDRSLVPRLRPLLRHPAFVPRIYVAMTLGKLHATETLPEILGLIREGYPFSDSVALASGKHFDQSQTVRWRGFLCMALGRMGGDEARAALERLADDPAQPRDIRYSAVVGLRFIGSPRSVPVLQRVVTNDIIWMVRDEARRAVEEIELLSKEQGR